MHVILAAIAEEEAKKNYHGNTTAAISTLAPLAAHFSEVEEGDALASLENGWGGAFVFHCLSLAGVQLPARYPDARVHSSFARSVAWEEYAKLPKIGLWRQQGEPEVGDLIFWTGKEADALYVGILLRMDEDAMELAVGDYHNHSAVVEHPLSQPIRGFVRLDV